MTEQYHTHMHGHKNECQAPNLWSKVQISLICRYALKNPLDTIACDLPVRIISSLNKENLKVTKNPFTNSPYKKSLLLNTHSKDGAKDNQAFKLLRNFWNGNFDLI